MPKYAQVIIDWPAKVFDKTFDYLIPENLAKRVGPGVKVLVPFGRKTIAGFVLFVSEATAIENPRPIIKIFDTTPLLNREMLDLAGWLSDYYFSFYISALKTVLIFGQSSEKISTPVRPPLAGGRRLAARQKLKSKIQNLSEPKIKLNLKTGSTYDKNAENILKAIEKQTSKKILLVGTPRLPIYLKLASRILQKNKSVIFIVPEEYFLEPVFEIFKQKFRGKVGLFKGTLGKNEKFRLGEKIKKNEIKILIGPRSAVLAPFEDLGLIIIEGEENPALKQANSPRYQALKIAEKRAENHKALLVLGSLSPSLETYFRTQTGEIVLYELPSKKSVKRIKVVDLNLEKKDSGQFKKDSRLIPLGLKIEIAHTLSKKKPVLVFINRRGFFTLTICKNCGEILHCPKCGKLFAYNNSLKKFVCGHCGNTMENPACGNCQASQFMFRGAGIERIEEALKKLFPATDIFKIDRGLNKTAYQKLIQKKPAGIYVATRAGLKTGLPIHFGLVGFLGFDQLLNLPDFRATEKLWSLLNQFFGEYFQKPEKIIIATRHPEHLIFQALSDDWKEFYQKELSARQALSYPPFSTLVILKIEAKDEKQIAETAEKLKDFFPDFEINPLPEKFKAAPKKARAAYLLKILDFESFRPKFKEFLKKLDKDISFNIDVEPVEVV